jgi:hypothetical protein
MSDPPTCDLEAEIRQLRATIAAKDRHIRWLRSQRDAARLQGDDETPDECPKGSLELAIDLCDELIGLADDAIEDAHTDSRLLDLKRRRAALQPSRKQAF